MDALGINRKYVDSAIFKGMKWKENDNNKWHANMAGIECVFRKAEQIIFVITVYKEEGKK